MSTETLSKRDLILVTAKSLFIEKGFRGTTIASIAEEAGIAKGSVYSYFSSKLEIVKALILQSDEKNQLLVEGLLSQSENKGMALLEEYLSQEFQEVLNERSFIQVFLSDEMIIMDGEVMSVLQESRINYHLSQQAILLQAYDDSIEPWLYDLVSVVNGLLNEYSVYLALDDANFSIKRCAHLMAYVIESSVQALVNSDQAPLLTKENFPLTQGRNTEQHQRKKAQQLIESIQTEANDMDAGHKALVLETIALLEKQLLETELNLTLIRALIANLRPYPELTTYRKRLADALDVELI